MTVNTLSHSLLGRLFKAMGWISLVFALLALVLTGCANRKMIVHELDEKEANEILVILANNNIEAIKEKNEAGGGGGAGKITLWNISVPLEQEKEAMSILNRNGLPRQRGQNLLNIFANTGLVPSEMTERVRFQSGLAETIASTIRKIDGILDAQVQISFPEEDPLNPQGTNKKKITASVYVKHSAMLDDPNVHLSTKIKRLVASSVTGLDYDNVTVILDRARFGNIEPGMSAPQEEKVYISVWSIIIAKESLTRFRILFFSFILFTLFLSLSLGWITWKLHPLLGEIGGVRALFTFHPIKKKEPIAEPSPSEKKEESSSESAPSDKEIEEG